MTTVVIAAHNEAAVLGGCLDSLLADVRSGELEVVVVANGCTDRTADVARARGGVRVLEIAQPSKIAALNAGDAVASGFPRIYLDAEIHVPTAGVRALVDALDGPARGLVAVPSRRLELDGRPWPVLAYYAVQRRLPVFEDALFGRGLIALSAEGRSRFTVFPDVIADDLFLDSLFSARERVRLPGVVTSVATPMRTQDLARRLVLVRRGNAALRTTATRVGAGVGSVRASDRWSWLRDVIAPRPWLAPAGIVYAALTMWASLIARRGPDDRTWDETTPRARPRSPDDRVDRQQLPPRFRDAGPTAGAGRHLRRHRRSARAGRARPARHLFRARAGRTTPTASRGTTTHVGSRARG